MCDELTEAENARWMAADPLTRRDFARLGAGLAAVAGLPGCGFAGEVGADRASVLASTIADEVAVPTPDGTADAFFVRPKEGRHPAVILWPDIAGLRGAYKAMATRLAGAGYAVLAVNHYYRSAKAPFFETISEWRTPEGQARIQPMAGAISLAGIASDAAAFTAWLDARSEVDAARKIGALGYCMTGSYTLRAAAALPDRIGAACSFHGGGLVTDTPDSPHLLIPRIEAAMLVAIAQNDDARQPEAKTVLKDAAASAGKRAEIEVYPAQHGWCTLDSPVFDEVQADRAWGRMLATLSSAL